VRLLLQPFHYHILLHSGFHPVAQTQGRASGCWHVGLFDSELESEDKMENYVNNLLGVRDDV
jgi:hypothetical protein